MHLVRNTINYIYIFAFIWITFIAFKGVFLSTQVACFVALPLGLVMVFIISRTKTTTAFFSPKKSEIIWLLIQTVSAVLTVIMAINLEVDLTWDWGLLLNSASKFVLEGNIDNPAYYARYPNNVFWVNILIYFFKFVKIIIPNADLTVFKFASVLLSCLFVQIALFFIYKSSCIIFSKQKGLIVGAIAAMCLPFYLFAQFAYTDTPAIMIISILIYLYAKNKNKNKVSWFVLIGVFSALIFKVKIAGFILIIAMVMDYLITSKGFKKKAVRLIAFVLSFLVITFTCGVFEKTQFEISEQDSEKYEFPVTHWIMLGLNDWGIYIQSDVDYTYSFENKQAKQKANIEVIKYRLKRRGVKGTLNHVFNTKLTRTWGTAALEGDNYMSRSPMKNTIFQRIFTVNGDLSYLSRFYCGVYHLLMIVGLLLAGIFSRNKDRMFYLKTALIGVAVFFSIWECNSRYLYIFLPILIILSCFGWLNLIGFLKTKKSS